MICALVQTFPKEPTVWHWQVTPVESGALTLIFKLSGKFKLGDKERLVDRDMFTQSFSITVDVNPEGFLKRNWKDLLAMVGGTLAAVAGGLWAYFTWWRPAPKQTAPPSPHPPVIPTTVLGPAVTASQAAMNAQSLRDQPDQSAASAAAASASAVAASAEAKKSADAAQAAAQATAGKK